MTADILQEKLIKRVEKVLENLELPTVSGERRKIKIYSQDLNIPDDEDEDVDIETTTAPYIISGNVGQCITGKCCFYHMYLCQRYGQRGNKGHNDNYKQIVSIFCRKPEYRRI